MNRMHVNLMRNKAFLPFMIIVGLLLLALGALFTGRLIILAAIPAMLFAVFCISHPQALMILAIGFFMSNLVIPGTSGRVDLHLTCIICFVICDMFLRWTRPRAGSVKRVRLYPFALFFILVLIWTGAIRGFGLKVLGSDLWGGRNYVVILVSGFFLLATRRYDLSPRHWRITVFLMCLLGTLPALADILYLISNGAIWQQFYLVNGVPREAIFAEIMVEMDELRRAQGGQLAAYMMCLFALLVDGLGLKKIWRIIFLVLAFVFAGLSGHRIAIVFIVLAASIYYSFNRKTQRWRFFNKRNVVFVVFLLFLGLMAPYTPLAMQRALSFIPFNRASYAAQLNASDTIAWRLTMWQRVIPHLPQYAIVGHGFAYSPYDIDMLEGTTFQIDRFIAKGMLHNGPLSLLYLFGVPGLVMFTCFVFAINIRHCRLVKRSWNNRSLQLIHLAFLATCLALTILFYFAHGGPDDFGDFCILAVVLEGLRRTDERLCQTGVDLSSGDGSRMTRESQI